MFLIDLLSISDRDTWAYGQAIRATVVEKGFDHITFSRLRDFVDFPLPEEMEEMTYVANAMNFRRFILNKFGKDDIDIDHEIATNPDTKLTYLGYRRFLESDLKHIFPLGNGRTSKSYKRDVKYLAKQMMIRGYVSYYYRRIHCRHADMLVIRLLQALSSMHIRIISA